MTDKKILIENHNDYMLEIKLNHFKNELVLLVDKLINLDSSIRTNNGGVPLSPINYSNQLENLLNIITNGEELIKEFNVIVEKFKDFENNETHINNKNLKNQIDNLKKIIREADSKIQELNELCSSEQVKIITIQKENSNLLEKIDKYKNTINDFEEENQSKNYELNKCRELVDAKSNEINILNIKLDTSINSGNNTEDNNHDVVISINDTFKLSKDYIIKLNEGNIKLISQKNETIKILEDDITNCNQKITYYESRITELEKININLENTISNINSGKQNPSLEIPLSIEMELNSKTEDITSLKFKIKKLEEELKIQLKSDLHTPLLPTQNKSRKCLSCSIL